MTSQTLMGVAFRLAEAVMADPGVKSFESDLRPASGRVDWKVSLPLGHPRQYPSLQLALPREKSLVLGLFLCRWSKWPWHLTRPMDGHMPPVMIQYVPHLEHVRSWRLYRWTSGFGFGDFGCPASPLPVAEDGTVQIKSAAGGIADEVIGAILRCVGLPYDEAAVQCWRTGRM